MKNENENKLKVWLISDTHERHEELIIPENVDVVIHAGDAANINNPILNTPKLEKFLRWYNNLPIPRKIFSPGNHDTSFEVHYINQSDFPNIEFLLNSSTKINGKNVYASPYTPSFGYGWAYNIDRDKIKYEWAQIPVDTNILITHGPPYGHLDMTNGEHVGCEALLKVIDEELYDLDVHVFGHIHTEMNHKNAGTIYYKGTKLINASVVNLGYKIDNNGEIIWI